MGKSMKVYLLMMDAGEYEFNYGIYSTLAKAEVAIKDAKADDPSDEGFFVKEVELDGKQSFSLNTSKTIDI